MRKIVEMKPHGLLKVGRKYVFRTFDNADGGVGLQVWSRKSWDCPCIVTAEALVTVSRDDWNSLTVKDINKIFDRMLDEYKYEIAPSGMRETGFIKLTDTAIQLCWMEPGVIQELQRAI